MKTIKHLMFWLVVGSPSLCYAQLFVDVSPIPSIDFDDVFDTCAINDVVFVYRYSQLPAGDKVCKELSEILPVDRAPIHARPVKEIRALINQRLEWPSHELVLQEARAINLGDQGFIWKVTWEIWFPGGWSGPMPQYFAYVNPDGSLMPTERYLHDSTNGGEPESVVCSVMSFADVVPDKDNELIHGDEALALAQSALEQFLKEDFEPGQAPKFRFYEQTVIDLPVDTDRNASLVTFKVWEVRFINADVTGENIHQTDPFTIWVTADGLVSQLTRPPWRPSSLRAKPESKTKKPAH